MFNLIYKKQCYLHIRVVTKLLLFKKNQNARLKTLITANLCALDLCKAKLKMFQICALTIV